MTAVVNDGTTTLGMIQTQRVPLTITGIFLIPQSAGREGEEEG